MLTDANFRTAAATGYRALLIMPFGSDEKYASIERGVRGAVTHYGITPFRADDRYARQTLWESLRSEMDRCELAIAVFDQRPDKAFNPNVLIEAGYMLARGADLLLLKERGASTLPTDLLGHLYREFDGAEPETTGQDSVIKWLRDLGLAKRNDERLVVFVSSGGSCRCAMSKIILLKALEGRMLPFDLSVMSLAASFGESDHASANARNMIQEFYGADLLASHRVRQRYLALMDEADLFLCAEEALMEGFPPAKTTTIGKFFGKGETIENPWPNDNSPQSKTRYRHCFRQLHGLISPRGQKLIDFLQATSPAATTK